MLNEIIDRIAGLGENPEPAVVVAGSLQGRDLREAAIIHLSALLEAEPSMLDSEKVIIAGLAIRLVPVEDPNAPIRYDDVGVGFDAEGASIVRRDGPTSLGKLLELYQFARDRSDILVYLPQTMRDGRIATLAKQTGASERFVRFILGHYPSLSARVTK